MSKEEYLKGEKKEVAFNLIRRYIAYRMTNQEMISNLKDNDCEISERTLRRYKQEIKETAGKTISEIYQHEIIDNFIEDVLTMKELQREGWKEYSTTRVSREKLKALALVRNATLDKAKLYTNVPYKFKVEKKLRKRYGLDELPGDEHKDLKN